MQLIPEFLPVGSIVEYNIMIHNRWMPVRLNATDILQCESDSKHFNKFHRPIPLTEKILTEWCNMRLERKQLSLNVGGELFEYAISSDNFCIYYSKLKGWTLDSRVTQNTVFIQYLHELQLCYLGTMLKPLPIQIK